MRRANAPIRLTAVAAICLLICFSTSPAGKPDKPGGGGGSGGGGDDGDSTSARFSVIELPIDGDPVALSEPDASGLVTVSIDASEAGYVSAAFALVDAIDGNVLASGYLPEPPFVDPNDGVMKNGWSEPGDVNIHGEIVGSAGTFDPAAPPEDPSPARAVLWVDDGSGYAYTLLPLPAASASSRAFGTNNFGDIVGQADTPDGRGAVLWDASTQAVVDLNTDETAALGWELVGAYDINDGRLIVGYGRLNGLLRGFALDVASGSIWAVPLSGPATENIATRVDSFGRIVGDAWDGDGDPWGAAPDDHLAYSWDGPGSVPTALPSITLNTSIAGGLNDLGATVGNSIIPTDDPFADRWVPTLWEIDAGGNGTVTELQAEIPDKPSWKLIRSHDVNNDGWISAFGRRRSRGAYHWRALILRPAN